MHLELGPKLNVGARQQRATTPAATAVRAPFHSYARGELRRSVLVKLPIEIAVVTSAVSAVHLRKILLPDLTPEWLKMCKRRTTLLQVEAGGIIQKPALRACPRLGPRARSKAMDRSGASTKLLKALADCDVLTKELLPLEA
eukprot:1733995-Pleurochrysis_carterae.AAC.7